MKRCRGGRSAGTCWKADGLDDTKEADVTPGAPLMPLCEASRGVAAKDLVTLKLLSRGLSCCACCRRPSWTGVLKILLGMYRFWWGWRDLRGWPKLVDG